MNREGVSGRIRKFLLKDPAQVQQARAGTAAYTQLLAGIEELSKINAEPQMLRRLREGRCDPLIALGSVVRCLILGVAVRIGSYLDLARQTQTRRRWRHLCHLKAAIGDDVGLGGQRRVGRLWLRTHL